MKTTAETVKVAKTLSSAMCKAVTIAIVENGVRQVPTGTAGVTLDALIKRGVVHEDRSHHFPRYPLTDLGRAVRGLLTGEVDPEPTPEPAPEGPERFCTVCHIHMNCHAPALLGFENNSDVCDIPRAELTLEGIMPPVPRAPRNTANPKVHVFASTGEAYDASQCHDDIVDGDVLSVPGAGVVAVLMAAWPVAVDTDTPGEFHCLKSGEEWSKTEFGDYTVSVVLAREVLADLERKHSAIADGAVRVLAPADVQGVNFEGVPLSTDEEAHLINLPPDGIGIVFGDLVAAKHVVKISRNRVERFAQGLVKFAQLTDPAPTFVTESVDMASIRQDRHRFTVQRREDFLTELATWCNAEKYADVVSAIRDLGPSLSRSQKWQDACAWVTTAMDEGREERYVALQGAINLGHVFPVRGAL